MTIARPKRIALKGRAGPQIKIGLLTDPSTVSKRGSYLGPYYSVAMVVKSGFLISGVSLELGGS